MNKRLSAKKLSAFLTVRGTVIIGVFLLFAVTLWAGHREMASTLSSAQSALNVMKKQCVSFNKLTTADRTKSLFRLSDMLRDFSVDLEMLPDNANDAYLEEYVDSLRLSGVALLDENYQLEASGYTRRFRDAAWMTSPNGSRFADILTYPHKVYAERVLIDGEYYDVCAVARKDKPGLIIGFYHQPTGLITDNENDLESMLIGLQLERDGHYAIAEDGNVRVAGEKTLVGAAVMANSLLKEISQIPKDSRLHFIRADGKRYWGIRSGCENYNLYIYYPLTSLIKAYVTTAAIFIAVYSIVLLFMSAMRQRTLYDKQEELRKSNHSLRQTVEMLRALETIYLSLFYVDVKANHYDSIYVAPWLVKAIPPKGVYTELKELFLDTMVVPTFRKEIDERMSFDFIRENLNRDSVSEVRKSYYTDYQAIRGAQIRWCRVTATVVDYDADGNPFHILALIQDINKEKAQEADYQAQILKEAEEAKIANRAKTDFLRRISHDIRTPVNGIQGYIDMANRHPEDIELQKHCRACASAALNSLLDLVNSVLDMSKMESNHLSLEDKPFDLSEMLDSLNAILIPQAAAKNVHYEVLRKGTVPFTHVIGSPRHFSQIIMNMTTNAVKYSKPGGYVRVNTCLVRQTPEEVTYEFICADNGIGMSQEFQQHMFEPFTQEAGGARTNYEGVGLGLSIMKKLVDAMGGTISCESEKGKGTTFRVQLTFRIDKTFEEPKALPETNRENLLQGKNVLLAEDNELNMEIAELLLVERGANVTRAYNGREAVEAFASSAVGFYDIIFMDIMMPELNGIEATKSIRAMKRADAGRVLILAMSANSFADDIQSCLNAGMNAHIAKPVDDKKILTAVSEQLCLQA